MFCIWAIIFIFHLGLSTSGISLNVKLQNSTGVTSVISNNHGPPRSYYKTFNFKNWRLEKIEQKLLLDIKTQEQRNRISITGTGTERVLPVDTGLEPRFEKQLFHFCLILGGLQPPPVAQAVPIGLWSQSDGLWRQFITRVKGLDPLENYVSLSTTF